MADQARVNAIRSLELAATRRWKSSAFTTATSLASTAQVSYTRSRPINSDTSPNQCPGSSIPITASRPLGATMPTRRQPLITPNSASGEEPFRKQRFSGRKRRAVRSGQQFRLHVGGKPHRVLRVGGDRCSGRALVARMSLR